MQAIFNSCMEILVYIFEKCIPFKAYKRLSISSGPYGWLRFIAFQIFHPRKYMGYWRSIPFGTFLWKNYFIWAFCKHRAGLQARTSRMLNRILNSAVVSYLPRSDAENLSTSLD